MNFVSIKTINQQGIQAFHNDRARLVGERTALANEIRGTLLEYGLTIPQGINNIIPIVMELLDPECDEIPSEAKELLSDFLEDFRHKEALIKKREEHLKKFAKANPQVQQLMTIPGIGVIVATAFVGKVGDVNVFKNGRQLAAWLGLVPKQNSTGGKIQLGRISKRGDRYLRSLLVHGARSVLRSIKHKNKEDLPAPMQWLKNVAERRGHNKGIVAFANKIARFAWALLSSGTDYQENYTRISSKNKLAT